MADIEYNSAYPSGAASVFGPIIIPENSSPYTAVLINESGLPDGTYRVDVQSTWSQDANKYLLLSAVINGTPTIAVTKEAHGPNDAINNESGWGLVEVTAGTLTYDLVYEFPDQGGNGDGTLLASQAAFMRIS